LKDFVEEDFVAGSAAISSFCAARIGRGSLVHDVRRRGKTYLGFEPQCAWRKDVA